MKGRHKVFYSKYSPLWSGPSWFFITECTYASAKSKWSLAFYNIPFLWNFVAFHAASMVGTKKAKQSTHETRRTLFSSNFLTQDLLTSTFLCPGARPNFKLEQRSNFNTVHVVVFISPFFVQKIQNFLFKWIISTILKPKHS